MSTETVERVRLTISVTPEVHAAFQRLAAASSMSISRTMGEWLGDTLDAVQFTASKVEEARAAPKMVMREVHAYALGLADETGALMKSMRERRQSPEATKPQQHVFPYDVDPTPISLRMRADKARRAASPPASNTGGKVPQRGAPKRRPK